MKKSSVYVVPATGGWAVQSKIGRQETKVYRSKEEAVTAARNSAPPRSDVVVRTSAGQILRPPQVRTSRNAESMRQAVSQTVQKKAGVRPK